MVADLAEKSRKLNNNGKFSPLFSKRGLNFFDSLTATFKWLPVIVIR